MPDIHNGYRAFLLLNHIQYSSHGYENAQCLSVDTGHFPIVIKRMETSSRTGCYRQGFVWVLPWVGFSENQVRSRRWFWERCG
jgi:hypothetical protein